MMRITILRHNVPFACWLLTSRTFSVRGRCKMYVPMYHTIARVQHFPVTCVLSMFVERFYMPANIYIYSQ